MHVCAHACMYVLICNTCIGAHCNKFSETHSWLVLIWHNCIAIRWDQFIDNTRMIHTAFHDCLAIHWKTCIDMHPWFVPLWGYMHWRALEYILWGAFLTRTDLQQMPCNALREINCKRFASLYAISPKDGAHAPTAHALTDHAPRNDRT